MSEYKREKITLYKIQYKPDDGEWRDLYQSPYTYWQAEMIVGYRETCGMIVRSIPVEISG